MVTGLGIHLRPMVRKGKSLLFGHISRKFKKMAPIFLPFLAELDIFESIETNSFCFKEIPLFFAFDSCNSNFKS